MKRLLFALVFCESSAGCPPTPTPPVPTADAAPAGPFTGHVYDCHAVSLADRQAAYEPVGICVASEAWPGCMADLLTSFAPATLACLARDLGSSANAAVLAGMASNTDVTTAKNVRAWIIQEGLGYK